MIEEKGIYITDKNNFKNDKKIIRNLSQISYRILNYILYIHLFFAKLITNNEDFDKFLQKGMNLGETLNECWNILKIELLKLDIDSIDKFMNYLFVYLFPILNSQNHIDDYKDLNKFELSLESEIQKRIKQFKEENINNNSEIVRIANSPLNLLKERRIKELKYEEIPFYKYFYYSDYLNEKYINEKLSHMDENKYPGLRAFLTQKNNINHDDILKY